MLLNIYKSFVLLQKSALNVSCSLNKTIVNKIKETIYIHRKVSIQETKIMFMENVGLGLVRFDEVG